MIETITWQKKAQQVWEMLVTKALEIEFSLRIFFKPSSWNSCSLCIVWSLSQSDISRLKSVMFQPKTLNWSLGFSNQTLDLWDVCRAKKASCSKQSDICFCFKFLSNLPQAVAFEEDLVREECLSCPSSTNTESAVWRASAGWATFNLSCSSTPFYPKQILN